MNISPLNHNAYLSLLQNIVESVPIRIFWKDRESRFLGCNTLFAKDAGFTRPDELIGKTDFDMGWKNQAELYRADDKLVMESGIPKLEYEELQTTPDGRKIWLRTSKVALLSASQEIIGILGIYEDITERKHTEQEQKRLTRALKLLSQCNSLLVHAEDEQELLTEICRLAVDTGNYLMAWVGFAEDDEAKTVRPVAQFGYEEGYLDGIRITWADEEQGRGPTGTAIRTNTPVVNQDYPSNPNMEPWREAATKRGYQSSIGIPLAVNKRVLGALTIYSSEPYAFGQEEVALLHELANDLAYGLDTMRTRNERDLAQTELAFVSQHDQLTGLPNRLLLHDRFELAITSTYLGNSKVAMLFLDLDNFKDVNDNLGHQYGDRLLLRVVERLQSCVSETGTVSRQGGDKFIILLTGMHDIADVETTAQNILDAFVEPLKVDGFSLKTTFSIGISLFPNDSQDFDTLIKQAEVALYQAKEAGKNTFSFYDDKMNANALEYVRLQGRLHSALDKNEFLLHYQPQIDSSSEQIIGAEALIRWLNPEVGLVPPNKFIPLAEQSGLIIPIGEWVLNEACRQAQIWRETHLLPNMSIAVNLSALQFKRGNIVETVVDALTKSGLPANLLELELTESILLQDKEVVMRTLHELKGIGVKLSIDDFGTGYSSLSYLKRLAVDKLKVDQSFVQTMAEDPDVAAIVKAIIQLGHTLQLTVIAEGVEDDAQLALLRNYGCNELQGYLFSRPTPAEDFVTLCKSMNT